MIKIKLWRRLLCLCGWHEFRPTGQAMRSRGERFQCYGCGQIKWVYNGDRDGERQYKREW